MDKTTKTILIVAALGVAGFFAYQYYKTHQSPPKTVPVPAPGTATVPPTATQPAPASAAKSPATGTSTDYGALASGLWDDVSTLWGN